LEEREGRNEVHPAESTQTVRRRAIRAGRVSIEKYQSAHLLNVWKRPEYSSWRSGKSEPEEYSGKNFYRV
jgi:hypothetical protein